MSLAMDFPASAKADKVEAKLETHEAVCAERYLGINARLKRLEMILIGAAGTLILLLLNIVIKLNG
jgi:hypothetical protein